MDSPNSIPPSTPLTGNFHHVENYSNSSFASPIEIENLKTISNKRIATFAHLHRVLEGKSHYFNTVTILKEEIAGLYDNGRLKKRSLQYFTLGSSLGPIIDIHHPMDFAKALSSLLNEYEGYLISDSGKTKRRPFFRKNKGEENSSGNNSSAVDASDFINLEVKNVIVDHVKVPVPPAYLEQMLKVDNKFKKIIQTVTKELDNLVRNSIKEELGIIDPLISQKSGYQFEDWDSMAMVKHPIVIVFDCNRNEIGIMTIHLKAT